MDYAPPTRVTRHLSAGAYIDEEFCRAALAEVYHQTRRMVAPSYGYDLPTVLDHCRRSRTITVVRDGVITGGLLLAACATPFTVLAVIGLLIQLQAGISVLRLMRQAVRQLREGTSLAAMTVLARTAVVMMGLLVAAFALFVISTMLATAWTAIQFGDGFDSSGLAVTQGTVLLLTFGVFAVPVAANVWRQRELDLLAPDAGARPPTPSTRYHAIMQQQSGNATVYSGYRPFVGSGEPIETAGFAQRLVRSEDPLRPVSEAAREFDEPPFTAGELINYLHNELRPLANDPLPERRLPGLTVEDRVFVSGSEVDQLSAHFSPPAVEHIIRNPIAPARHYLACQVLSWQGELVTSVYVHVAVQGRTLYLELSSWMLPPCDDRFRVVDQVGGTGAAAHLRALWRGLVDTPRTVGRAPLNLVRAGLDALTNAAAGSGGVGPVRRGYDYGARVSVRELGSADLLRVDAQTQDVVKHKRIIERRVVASVFDFLESRGVDTTEYQQRAMTVLNGSIVNTGNGTVNIKESAVGPQSQVHNVSRAGT